MVRLRQQMLRSYVNVLFCALKSLLTFVVLKQTKTKNIHKTLYSQTLWFSRYNVYSMMIFFPKKGKRKRRERKKLYISYTCFSSIWLYVLFIASKLDFYLNQRRTVQRRKQLFFKDFLSGKRKKSVFTSEIYGRGLVPP